MNKQNLKCEIMRHDYDQKIKLNLIFSFFFSLENKKN